MASDDLDGLMVRGGWKPRATLFVLGVIGLLEYATPYVDDRVDDGLGCPME